MSAPEAQPTDEKAGVLYAGLAYTLWGVIPLYWLLLSEVPPFELTVHRILWCALFVFAITLVTGNLPRAMAVLKDRRVFGTLVLTSVLISINWSIYIYAVATKQMIEGSLGYYITPLISFALGYVFFGETISRWRLAGIALAVVALGFQIAALGHVPWIAPSLALSFGLYGYFRKRAPVASLDGLLIETGLMFPIALILILWWGASGTGAFRLDNLTIDALLIGGGPMTAAPLALFAAGARRIRMTTLGFLQYLAPSITLVLAVFALGEDFSTVDMVAFGFVWTALIVVALEGRGLRDLRAAAMRLVARRAA